MYNAQAIHCLYLCQGWVSAMAIVYEYYEKNTLYQGYMLNDRFEKYISDRVGPRYRDEKGDQLLSDMGGTNQVGFDSTMLKTSVSYIPSRIAEVLAECFLMDSHDILIPYNRLRDSINPKTSITGPDIIGIANALFVFGETKSSSEMRHPPSVVDGKSGLIAQLNNIKLNKDKRIWMIKWLGHKTLQTKPDTNHAAWLKAKQQYFISEGRNFKMCGMLIRDTKPDERDVTRVYSKVSADMHASTLLDIMALYIPVPIQRLPEMVI